MKFKIPDTPEELFRQGGKSFSQFNKWIPVLFFVFFILFVGLTSFYTIEPDEVGVIRRFGKFTRITEPGLHWKLPFNVEKLDKVKVKRIYKEEFGFRTEEAGVKTRYSSKNFSDESLMLTGDLNILDVTWIVQFRIKDPVKLLFNIRNPKETVRDLSESVMRQVIGDSSVSEALTTRRVEVNLRVQEKLQEILDSYDSGVYIETVKLQDVDPPQKVQKSFNEVNEAKQQKEKGINEATERRNKIIPEEVGKANKVISEAEAYAITRINAAQGDTVRFLQLYDEYRSAKDVTRKRLYLETIETILPRAGKIYIFEPEANQVFPLLKLNQGDDL